MLTPGAGLFVFHCSLTRYGLPAFIGTTAWTKAAFGEKVPANPPLSFQATMLPLTLMPRSWLYPAVAVHRSALPPRMACEFTLGVIVNARLVESMSVQVLPLLPARWYCAVLSPMWG